MTIALIKESPNSWVFQHNLPDEVEENLDYAIDYLESGDIDKAEDTLRKLILVCPTCIDAFHHLALVFSERGLELESYLCLREAVRIGLEAIPSKFSWTSSRMLWLHIQNRPFMRAYHALGLSILEHQGAASAIPIFSRLVSINHNDNLGCRHILMQCHLDLNEWQAALKLSQRYNSDVGPDIVYSKAIALFQLGQDEEAITVLTSAIERYPNIARELVKIKHSPPKSNNPNYITVGGEDEAYDYWQHNRKHWASSTTAYKTLKNILEK